MGSIFNKLLTLGPSVFVVKAIIAAIVGDILFVASILVRRTYRKRYFRKLDERVSWVRRNWESLLCGEIPFEAW